MTGERSMPRALVLAALTWVLVLAGGCGGGDGGEATPTTTQTTSSGTTTVTATRPDEDPGEFIEENITQALRRQFGRNWDTLHPAHQAVVSREDYAICEAKTEGVGTTVRVNAVETYEEPVRVAGEGTMDSEAVTIRLSYDNPLTGKKVEEHSTVHAVAVDGEWRWILTPDDYRVYAKGGCPEEED